MLAFLLSANTPLIEFFVYPVLAGFTLLVLGLIVRAGIQTFTKRSKDTDESHDDFAGFARFFFGTKQNRRTGVPEERGWVDKVEGRFDDLSAQVADAKATASATQDLVREVKKTVDGIAQNGAKA